MELWPSPSPNGGGGRSVTDSPNETIAVFLVKNHSMLLSNRELLKQNQPGEVWESVAIYSRFLALFLAESAKKDYASGVFGNDLIILLSLRLVGEPLRK